MEPTFENLGYFNITEVSCNIGSDCEHIPRFVTSIDDQNVRAIKTKIPGEVQSFHPLYGEVPETWFSHGKQFECD